MNFSTNIHKQVLLYENFLTTIFKKIVWTHQEHNRRVTNQGNGCTQLSFVATTWKKTHTNKKNPIRTNTLKVWKSRSRVSFSFVLN